MNIMNAVFGVGASAAPILATAFRYTYARAVFSYWAIVVADVLCILSALAVPATKNPRLVFVNDADVNSEPQNSGEYVDLQEGGQKEDWLAIVLCGGSVLFAGVCEAAVAFWLFAYSTEQLQLSADAAGTLNTVFFLTFTATRFVCGWLVTLVGAASILKWSLAAALSASLGIAFPLGGAWMPCLGMIGVGVGVAPFAANAPTVLRQKTFISGRAQGSIRIMAALGAMIGASGTGFLQKWALVGDAAMPTVVLLGLVAETVVSLAFLR